MAVICTQCGTPATSAISRDAGSGCLELFLWLCGILPGLIYHLWRSDSQRRVCPSCGSPAIVPMSSPVGMELQRRFGVNEAAFVQTSGARKSNDGVGWWILASLVVIYLICYAATR